ncbi:hydrolase [Gallaecimonas sp. GXIMD4217]|uniref:hydrolase n=1 Tax=Gallaecimonas sp. GXIMD4217 TaxID=3131927 RepID=UPI00311B065F
MITESHFRPALGLGNCHAQTVFPRYHRPRPWIPVHKRLLALPDGDQLQLCYPQWPQADPLRPIVLLLHGLEGSVDSPYIQGQLQALMTAGFQPLVMHFRGCGGLPNLLPRAYHSGDSADPRFLAGWLRRKFPGQPLMAVGYSLGGNVLLKWLGEDGGGSPLSAAVAVSAPLELSACARRIRQGLSRFYQRHLLASLKESLGRKARDPALARQLPDLSDKTLFADFYRFDDAFTAPLHGFRDVHDYYQRASSKPLLKDIRVPTLVLHALDDPFICPTAVPRDNEVSAAVHMELSRQGGHVGFVSGSAWRPRYWLEERIPAFLAEHR